MILISLILLFLLLRLASLFLALSLLLLALLSKSTSPYLSAQAGGFKTVESSKVSKTSSSSKATSSNIDDSDPLQFLTPEIKDDNLHNS